ncbi:unnamed protein product, partial [Iphiclides podalirius]
MRTLALHAATGNGAAPARPAHACTITLIQVAVAAMTTFYVRMRLSRNMDAKSRGTYPDEPAHSCNSRGSCVALPP